MKQPAFRMGLYFCLGLLLILGCSSAPEVRRTDVGETIDLSGKWNDSDSHLVAEEMISDCLGRPWLDSFKSAHGGKNPVVIVGTVLNRSHEHINTQTFTNDMERALINSGSVEFVASRAERSEIRAERADQDLNASAETRKAMGQEVGADYMLKGDINTIIDTDGRSQVRYYQVDLTLISLKDNRKVWIGQKKIKKAVANAPVRY